jgi:flagellar biosynthesis/type III secretory pathway chaperone
MMNAAQRLAAIDSLPAVELCALVMNTLDTLVSVLNQETTLLRAGRLKDAGELTSEKTRLAQDYMGFARSVQRQLPRLREEAPAAVEHLRSGHERLATQMAENLKVIATARAVTEDLLTDVATALGAKSRPRTYGATGQVGGSVPPAASGVSINRAL